MSQYPNELREAPGLNVGYLPSKLISMNPLTVEDVRFEFCEAFKEICDLSRTDGSFLFSSTKEPWNTWFGLIFTTRCFIRTVNDARAVLWATFKRSSDPGLRELVRAIADKRQWCAIDNECRGLDAALTDGHAGGICAAEFEADSIVTVESDGVSATKHLNDLEKLMKLPFRFRIFHGRANKGLNRKEDAYKDNLAAEKVSEIIYAHRDKILPGDQVFASVVTTSSSKGFRHAIGEWKGPGLNDDGDTFWNYFDTRL